MVAVRFIFHDLGEDALGVIYFTLALNSILCGALEMGVSSTVVREVAAHHLDNPEHVRDLLRTASSVYWIIYLILAAAVFWTAPFLVHRWIHLRSMAPDTAVMVIRLLGIAAATVLPRSLYVSIFRGLERMEVNNTIDAVVSIVQQVGAATIILLGGGLLVVTCWLAGMIVVWLGLYVVLCGQASSWGTLKPGFSRSSVERTFRFTAHMASVSILSVVHVQADKTIVSKLMAIGDLGYYGIASQLVTRATLLTNSVAQAAFPSLSASIKQGDRAAALRKYRKLQDLICLGIVPLYAAIVFASVPLFSAIFSRRIALGMVLPTTWLSLGQYMNGTLTIPYLYSVADGRPDIAVRLNAFALMLTVPLSIWLTIRFGLSGAAFSWVAYHIFAYSYGLPSICRECIEVSPAVWYRHAFRIMLLAGLTYGGAYYVSTVYAFDSSVIMVSYVAASLSFCIFAWYMADKELRKTVSLTIQQALLGHARVALL